MFKRRRLNRSKSRKMFSRHARGQHPKNRLLSGIASAGMRGGTRF